MTMVSKLRILTSRVKPNMILKIVFGGRIEAKIDAVNDEATMIYTVWIERAGAIDHDTDAAE